MNLHTLTPADGSVKKEKRIGRGQGSGHGRKSTRGSKGAGQRSGTKNKRGFEGGQMPLQRRLPKFGFKNINRIEFQVFNLDTLQKLAEKHSITEFTKDFFVASGLAHKDDRIKILGRGAVNKALNVTVDAVSEKAKQIIEAAGGKVTILVFERAEDAVEIVEAKKTARKEAMKLKTASAPKADKAPASKAKKTVKPVDEVAAPIVQPVAEMPAVIESAPKVEEAPKADDVTPAPTAIAEGAVETIEAKSNDTVVNKEAPEAPATDEAEKTEEN